jgi:hypothetical protein
MVLRGPRGGQREQVEREKEREQNYSYTLLN